MAGISDLGTLIRSMKPKLNGGRYVFCAFKGKVPPRIGGYVMRFEEAEGTTLIIESKAADRAKLPSRGNWAWITLTVRSDLAAVGFLAAMTRALASEGISVNAVSAYHHDHLFVPAERAAEAMAALRKLSELPADIRCRGTDALRSK